MVIEILNKSGQVIKVQEEYIYNLQSKRFNKDALDPRELNRLNQLQNLNLISISEIEELPQLYSSESLIEELNIVEDSSEDIKPKKKKSIKKK